MMQASLAPIYLHIDRIQCLMNLYIRKMTLEDIPAVIELDQKSFSLPWPERSFRFELTDNPASRCWVAEVDGSGRGHDRGLADRGRGACCHDRNAS